MQDLRSIPNGGGNGGGGGGGGGRFFGGDRRLRPYPNQALKCPRCDSLNTKFCYYNNYNLSQPRHFCKSCRRYWTKGGVLRNVPVGGGCRKTKRSKPKSSSSSDHHPHHHHHHHQKEKKSSNSHSSSESSSLTATTTNDAAAVGGGGGASSSSVPGLLSFPDSRLFMNQTSHNPNFQLEILDQSSAAAAAAVADCGIFAENGSFTSLMSVGNTYNFNEITPFRINHQEEIELQEQQKMTSMVEEMKMQELTAAACMDQTVGIELSGIENRTSNGGGGGGGGLDWQSSQGLFDLPNSVDHGYWNQNQWADNDQHLYLP